VIVQINISAGGLPKLPIALGQLGRLGLHGDQHLYRFHGGPKKALLLIASEFVDTLRAEGFSVYYGALGENLTTRGLDHRLWKAGQRFQAGETVIELTEPRVPCKKLNPYGRGIQKRVVSEGGFYASVIRGGVIYPGDRIELLSEEMGVGERQAAYQHG
jgi:MOSC domain-containing protein YiiM